METDIEISDRSMAYATLGQRLVASLFDTFIILLVYLVVFTNISILDHHLIKVLLFREDTNQGDRIKPFSFMQKSKLSTKICL